MSHVLKYKYRDASADRDLSPHIYTEIGWKNFQAWLFKGGFDNIPLYSEPARSREAHSAGFSKPAQSVSAVHHRTEEPSRLSLLTKHGVKLIMYGENQAEYHNKLSETATPLDGQIALHGHRGQQYYFGGVHQDELVNYGLGPKDLDAYLPLQFDDAERTGIEIHYMSYYHKWVPQENYYYGRRTLRLRAESGTFGRHLFKVRQPG